MILLLVCRAAVMSGRISIQRTSVLLCLEEIHAGRDPSAKLGMLYIRFPTKIKALTQINLKKKKKKKTGSAHTRLYFLFKGISMETGHLIKLTLFLFSFSEWFCFCQ